MTCKSVINHVKCSCWSLHSSLMVLSDLILLFWPRNLWEVILMSLGSLPLKWLRHFVLWGIEESKFDSLFSIFFSLIVSIRSNKVCLGVTCCSLNLKTLNLVYFFCVRKLSRRSLKDCMGCPLGTGVLKPETPKGVQFNFDVWQGWKGPL